MRVPGPVFSSVTHVADVVLYLWLPAYIEKYLRGVLIILESFCQHRQTGQVAGKKQHPGPGPLNLHAICCTLWRSSRWMNIIISQGSQHHPKLMLEGLVEEPVKIVVYFLVTIS